MCLYVYRFIQNKHFNIQYILTCHIEHRYEIRKNIHWRFIKVKSDDEGKHILRAFLKYVIMPEFKSSLFQGAGNRY